MRPLPPFQRIIRMECAIANVNITVLRVEIPPALERPTAILLHAQRSRHVHCPIAFPPTLRHDVLAIRRDNGHGNVIVRAIGVGGHGGIVVRSGGRESPLPNALGVDTLNVKSSSPIRLLRLFSRVPDQDDGCSANDEGLAQGLQKLVVFFLEFLGDDEFPLPRQIHSRSGDGPSLAGRRDPTLAFDLCLDVEFGSAVQFVGLLGSCCIVQNISHDHARLRR
mmetsp:Transcript_11694/g.22557  ORF Transcript_11694/g.22557 Transcript_11694/m.22557 type:complete len:222 (-) Transcript_11694:255-920(-)